MSETTDYVDQMYPEVMEVIRYAVGEGDIDVTQPTEAELAWGRKAALGSVALELPIAQLANATRQAHRDRYLEGKPMLKDLTSEDPGQGLDQVQRFHFIRRFVSDQKAVQAVAEDPKLPGVAKALYIEPSAE